MRATVFVDLDPWLLLRESDSERGGPNIHPTDKVDTQVFVCRDVREQRANDALVI